MDILVKTPIPFPIEDVFLAMQDHLPKLAQYMPNIERVTVLERQHIDQNRVYLVNKWQAAATEIPTIARPFVQSDKTYWIDRATWNSSVKEAKWALEMGFMPDRVQCSGTTSYHRIDDNTTQMRVQGNISLNLKGLVPRLLLKKATAGCEKYVRTLVQPNFQKTADALTAYLKAQGHS